MRLLWVCFYLCASHCLAAITIEGRVVNALTNESVPGAQLKLTCLVEGRMQQLCKEVSETTLADGTFHFDVRYPFKYLLKATGAAGLVAIKSSQIEADFTRHYSSLSDVLLKLSPEASLTGKVLDENGQPNPDVVVEALRQSISGATIQIAMVSKAVSNQKGVYVLRSLVAGNYYVSTAIAHVDKNDPTHPFLMYAPDSLSLDQAVLTHLDAGQSYSDIDLHLRPVIFHHLEGRAQMDTSGSIATDKPQLHLDARDSAGVSLPSREIVLNPDGTFQTDVLPGAYTLRLTGALALPQPAIPKPAVTQPPVSQGQKAKTPIAPPAPPASTTPPPTVHLLAKQDIEVGGKDLYGLILLIPPPITVTGHAYLEGANETAIGNGRVTIRPVEAGAIGGPQTVEIQPDGSFTFTNCDPASYAVRFLPPAGAYIKSLVFNQQQDALTHLLDLSKGTGGDLTIVVRSGAASVTGAIADAPVSQDASGSLQKLFEVALISDLWEENNLVPVRHASSKDGHFSMNGIPPGHYSAIATTGVEMRLWENGKFVREMQARGVGVDLAESDQKQISVPYLSFDEVDQLQSRLGIN